MAFGKLKLSLVIECFTTSVWKENFYEPLTATKKHLLNTFSWRWEKKIKINFHRVYSFESLRSLFFIKHFLFINSVKEYRGSTENVCFCPVFIWNLSSTFSSCFIQTLITPKNLFFFRNGGEKGKGGGF